MTQLVHVALNVLVWCMMGVPPVFVVRDLYRHWNDIKLSALIVSFLSSLPLMCVLPSLFRFMWADAPWYDIVAALTVFFDASTVGAHAFMFNEAADVLWVFAVLLGSCKCDLTLPSKLCWYIMAVAEGVGSLLFLVRPVIGRALRLRNTVPGASSSYADLVTMGLTFFYLRCLTTGRSSLPNADSFITHGTLMLVVLPSMALIVTHRYSAIRLLPILLVIFVWNRAEHAIAAYEEWGQPSVWAFLSATYEQFAGSDKVETNPVKQMFLADVMMCNGAIALGVIPLVKNVWYVPLAAFLGVMVSPAVLMLAVSLYYAAADNGAPEEDDEGTRSRSVSLSREDSKPKVA